MPLNSSHYISITKFSRVELLYQLTKMSQKLVDDKFVWKKKQERDGLDKLSPGQQEMLAEMKEKEKKVELWKVGVTWQHQRCYP